ncbi:hypothetical protein [Haloplanus halophilus]|uniref:hypothetical protein n=1 Tax=Haloplanus halophilus TaxID=2949993 RepID=UPI002040EE05|nr:hypothetical protein [Haloplanus sp. GDY1]
MGVEGFVCWTARTIEDRTELRRVLTAQLPSGLGALRDAREAGLLDGTTPTAAGLAAAQEFADRSGLPMAGPTDAIADFGVLLEGLLAAEDERRAFVADAVPEGFDRVTPSIDRFDREYHTVNVAREYPSGAEVELNYRSRDPSHPGEEKPNRSSAILWLRGGTDRTYEHRAEWTEG